MPPPELPNVSQQLREAKREFNQANRAYEAAMDLLARSKQAVISAEQTANQALSAKIAAQTKLEATFQAFRDSPDEP